MELEAITLSKITKTLKDIYYSVFFKSLAMCVSFGIPIEVRKC